VYYAIAFLAGMRLGEVSGRRFRDYDDKAVPLGQLLVATQYDDKDLKGDRPSREVPVHPTLAKVLAEWRLHGFALVYGRHPTPEDFIVPKRAIGRNRLGNRLGITPGAQQQQNVWRNFQVDLKKIGLRPRRVHDTRRTFISLSKADGADKYLCRWVTHGPRKEDAWDDYNSPPWDALCEQVAKLKIGLRGRAAVVSINKKSAQRKKP
jgi:integrase